MRGPIFLCFDVALGHTESMITIDEARHPSLIKALGMLSLGLAGLPAMWQAGKRLDAKVVCER